MTAAKQPQQHFTSKDLAQATAEATIYKQLNTNPKYQTISFSKTNETA